MLGAKHIHTLETANSLARVLRYQGKQSEALNILRDTVTFRGSVLGPRHHDTISSMNNLAGCLSEMKGKSLEAEKMFKDVIRILIQTLGETHRITINACGNLGIVYLKRDDVSDIEKGRAMVTNSLKQLLSPPHNCSEKQSWVRKFRKALIGDLNRSNRDDISSSPSPPPPFLSNNTESSLNLFSSKASLRLERLKLDDDGDGCDDGDRKIL